MAEVFREKHKAGQSSRKGYSYGQGEAFIYRDMKSWTAHITVPPSVPKTHHNIILSIGGLPEIPDILPLITKSAPIQSRLEAP